MKFLMCATTSLCLTLPILSYASIELGGEKGFCSATAKAALNACKFGVLDDYWIAIGNCKNLSNAKERWQCKKDAQEESIEAHEECNDQYEARLEICEVIGEQPYDPQIDPSEFVDPSEIGNGVAANPYFPLEQGRTWTYEGGDETVVVTVTNDTKEILGVTCAVVTDIVSENGDVIEDTKDWFAQDIYGNVWYFGEIAQEFEDGELVGVEGSWEAGKDGAKPGIIMKASPVIGDVYRQEFALGTAEDMGEVVSLSGSETVPAASCVGDCLITKDFTPLEPDVEENKYYKPGVGLILEIDQEEGERLELVSYSL